MYNKIWIGLKHTKPANIKSQKFVDNKSNGNKCIGLYTNLFGIAKNNDEFAEKARVFSSKKDLK